MAAKKRTTISSGESVKIDREAFDRLERARGAGESFSAVIKRCIRPRQSAADILRSMRAARISTSTLRSIEESAARRRRIAHKSKG